MQIPVDIGAVINEATNIDEARKTPLSVAVFIDETAPSDIQSFARHEFTSMSEHAMVNMVSFPTFPIVAVPGADMAVIVAGFDEKIGQYAAMLRDSGAPVMVVSTMPQLVADIANSSGYPLLIEDIASPALPNEKKTSAEALAASEPLALDDEGVQSLRKRMGDWVIATCYKKRLAFALAFRFVRKPLSLEAVNATSAQNAGVGLVVFLPGADMPIMTLNQAKMLLQIAAAYGEPMSLERVKELAAVIGGAFAFRSVARQLIAFVPALGWAIKAVIGYTGTQAMGRAAVEYFEADGSITGLANVVAEARDKVAASAVAEAVRKTMKSK